MNAELQKNIIRFITLVFVIIFIISLMHNHAKKERLKSDFRVTTGVIFKAIGGGHGSFYVDYKFVIDNKIFIGHSSYPLNRYDDEDLINKTFPVVYCYSDYNNSEMLILPENFEEFYMKFPDSLAWVKKLPRF